MIYVLLLIIFGILSSLFYLYRSFSHELFQMSNKISHLEDMISELEYSSNERISEQGIKFSKEISSIKSANAIKKVFSK